MNLVTKIFCLCILVSPSFAGPKEDLVEAIKSQCKKTEDEAKNLSTPGRTGSIIQFKQCTKSPVELEGGCKVTCTKDNASIGG